MDEEPPGKSKLQQMGMGIYRIGVHCHHSKHVCRDIARSRAVAFSGHILRLTSLASCELCGNLDKGAT